MIHILRFQSEKQLYSKKSSAALSSCAGSIFAWLAAYLHLKLT